MSRLTLLAQSPEDLAPISALLQDATLRTPDIGLDSKARRLALLTNRYRWEASTPSRTRAGLRIETVLKAEHRNWPGSPEAVLNLLSLGWAEPHLTLNFSDAITLRLTCEALDLVLEDLSDPWPTQRQPTHKL
jgi:hypothetical protein